MEMTRQKIETHVRMDPNTKQVQEVGESKGPIEKLDFGSPDDLITAAVGGGYVAQWNPDFLQTEFGQTGAVARFYFDKRVAVEIGDSETKVSQLKRHLLFQNGFGYLCIPPHYASGTTKEDLLKLRSLYQASLEEYYAYDRLHPRPSVIQDALITDEKGVIRRAKMRAIDIKVGGQLTGNAELQAKDLSEAKPLKKSDIKTRKKQVRALKAIRRAMEQGKPFRNPFIGKNKRLYSVAYV